MSWLHLIYFLIIYSISNITLAVFGIIQPILNKNYHFLKGIFCFVIQMHYKTS